MSLMPFTGTRSHMHDPMWDWTVSDPHREDLLARTFNHMRDANKLTPLLTSDLIEKENEYQVYADLPGVSPEDIDITLEDHCLCMKAERKHVHEHETDTVHTMERSFGKVNRRMILPRDADCEHLVVKFKNGVLSVTVPKKEAKSSTSRKIPISSD